MRQSDDSAGTKLPVAETINAKILGDPAFKHFDKDLIDRFAEAVHKVADNAASLKGWQPAKPAPQALPGWNRKA